MKLSTALLALLLCMFFATSLADGHSDHDMDGYMDLDEVEEEMEEHEEMMMEESHEDDEEDEETTQEDEEDEETTQQEEEEDEEEDEPKDVLTFTWYSSYAYLHPTMENTIEVDVDGDSQEYTVTWSSNPQLTLTTDGLEASFTADLTAGQEYTFTVMLVGENGDEYTDSETWMANDLPSGATYEIAPTTGDELSTDYTHTWTAASDNIPEGGDLLYSLFRVDGDDLTLLSVADTEGSFTRFHIAGDEANSFAVTFQLQVEDDAGAYSMTNATATVNELSEAEKTTAIENAVDDLLNNADADASSEEKVQNLGKLDSLTQALVFDSGDSDEEESAESIAAKTEVTNNILTALSGTFDAEDDAVVDAALNVAETVSSNGDYLDDSARDTLLDLFADAAGRNAGLSEDTAAVAVSGLSNVVDSILASDDSSDADSSTSENLARVDAIVDSLFDAVFTGDSDVREMEIDTPQIKATFVKTDPEDVAGDLSAGDDGVSVPDTLGDSLSLPAGSSVLVKFASKGFNAYDSDATIGSNVVEFSLKSQSDAGEIEELTVTGLANPVTITITLADGADADAAECRFWDDATMMWSSEGMTKVSVTDGKLICESTHLTDFASEEVEAADEEEEADSDDDTEEDDTTTSAAALTLAFTTLAAMLF